jgi:hypothetical protein
LTQVPSPVHSRPDPHALCAGAGSDVTHVGVPPAHDVCPNQQRASGTHVDPSSHAGSPAWSLTFEPPSPPAPPKAPPWPATETELLPPFSSPAMMASPPSPPVLLSASAPPSLPMAPSAPDLPRAACSWRLIAWHAPRTPKNRAMPRIRRTRQQWSKTERIGKDRSAAAWRPRRGRYQRVVRSASRLHSASYTSTPPLGSATSLLIRSFVETEGRHRSFCDWSCSLAAPGGCGAG